jgi:hypothetical protein
MQKIDINKAIEIYEQRLETCKIIQKEHEQLPPIQLPRTVLELRDYLKKHTIMKRIPRLKSDLQVLVKENMENTRKFEINDANNGVDHYTNHLTLLKRAKETGIVDKFNEAIDQANEKIPFDFTDVVDYNSYTQKFITNYIDKKDAEEVYNALQTHLGEMCAKHGGGWGYENYYELAYLDDVKLIPKDNNEFEVQTKLIEINENPYTAHCSKTGTSIEKLETPDLQEFDPFIGSWKISCIANKEENTN